PGAGADFPLHAGGDQRRLLRQLRGLFTGAATTAVHRRGLRPDAGSRPLSHGARLYRAVGRRDAARQTARGGLEDLPARTADEAGPDEHGRVARKPRAVSRSQAGGIRDGQTGSGGYRRQDSLLQHSAETRRTFGRVSSQKTLLRQAFVINSIWRITRTSNSGGILSPQIKFSRKEMANVNRGLGQFFTREDSAERFVAFENRSRIEACGGGVLRRRRNHRAVCGRVARGMRRRALRSAILPPGLDRILYARLREEKETVDGYGACEWTFTRITATRRGAGALSRIAGQNVAQSGEHALVSLRSGAWRGSGRSDGGAGRLAIVEREARMGPDRVKVSAGGRGERKPAQSCELGRPFDRTVEDVARPLHHAARTGHDAGGGPQAHHIEVPLFGAPPPTQAGRRRRAAAHQHDGGRSDGVGAFLPARTRRLERRGRNGHRVRRRDAQVLRWGRAVSDAVWLSLALPAWLRRPHRSDALRSDLRRAILSHQPRLRRTL